MNTCFFRFLLLPLTKGLNTEQKSKTSKGCLLEKCWKSKLEMDGLKYEKKSGRVFSSGKTKNLVDDPELNWRSVHIGLRFSCVQSPRGLIFSSMFPPHVFRHYCPTTSTTKKKTGPHHRIYSHHLHGHTQSPILAKSTILCRVISCHEFITWHHLDTSNKKSSQIPGFFPDS